MQYMQTLDLSFTQWLVSLQTDWAVTLWTAISTLGNAGACWIVLTLVLLSRKQTRMCGITMAVALLLGVLVGNLALKNLIARPRPFVAYPEIIALVTPGDAYSFPSGHTLSSFAAATSLYLFYPKQGVYTLVLAGLIGFSRLYLHVHYFTDVLAGALLGILLAWCAQQLVQYYARKRL